MTRDEVLEALTASGNATAADCVQAVKMGEVAPTFPPLGAMTVQEATVLYKHRRTTMQAANIPFGGLDSLLHDFSRRSPTEQVQLAGFTGANKSYVAFIDRSGVAVGCVRVEKGG